MDCQYSKRQNKKKMFLDSYYLLAHWCYTKNFGDALNPYLLNKLTGKKIIYCNYEKPDLWNCFVNLCRSILHFRTYNLRLFSSPTLKRPVILAIGSILSRSHSNYLVWGAGYMSKSEKGKGGHYFAVRGPFSAKMLEDEGYDKCVTFGDPALLLPLIYTPKQIKKSEVGFIPHLKDKKKWLELYPNERIISLTSKIEDFIDITCSNEYIISSSLHGIIVAHAYGIPALWVKDGDIDTDGIKFHDYLASVGISLYDGNNFEIDYFIGKKYNNLPNDIKSLMLPHIKISNIQKDLLKVDPFKIKSSILKKVKLL